MRQLILIINLLFLSSAILYAQDIKISGTITSADTNEPLIGATVVVNGNNKATATDLDGKFSLNVPKNSTLVATYIGYEKQIISVGNVTKLNIKLLPKSSFLNEVAVIGYGTVKRTESTVASSSIRASDMKTYGTTSFEQSLQGKLSGVAVTNTEGAPGSAMSIEIRGVTSLSGSSEPLYVIDGMPVNSSSDMNASLYGHSSTGSMNVLSTLNPNDIQSIEVLKDAAGTAIYGSRGSNGVVMITTKSGSEGKTKVDLNYNHSYSKITKKIDVLTPREYAEYINWALNYPDPKYVDDPLAPEYSRMPAEGGSTTKWQDVIYRLGKTDEYSLSVSGGKNGLNYMISGDYYNQDGIIINSGFKRMSTRSKLSLDLSPNVKLISNTNLSRGIYNSVPTSVRNGDVNQRGVVSQALLFNPACPLNYNPTEDEGDDANALEARRNPYLEAANVTRNTTNNRLTSNLNLIATIAKRFELNIMAGTDYSVSRGDTYYPENTQQGASTNGNDTGLGGISYNENLNWINENQLTYSNTFNKVHNIKVTGVFSVEENTQNSLRNSVRGFANDDLKNYVLQYGLAETLNINSGTTKTSLMSYTSRLNYGYASRYLFTATMRADGSSKFGKNNRFGYFPSVAFAWNAMNEPLFKNAFEFLKIDNLKLRASWGAVGNQNIPAYRAQNTLSFGWYTLNGGLFPSVIPTRLDNPDLKWETTNQTNIGFDLGFFNSRLTATVNAYYKKTTGLLQSVIIPGSTGFSNQYENSGDIENKGLELEITGEPIKSNNFKWRIAGNISFNRNKILSLGPGVTEQFTGNLGTNSTMNFTPFIQKIGYSLGTIWGFRTDGIYQNTEDIGDITSSALQKLVPGEINVLDLNGDKSIDNYDREKIGDVNPDYTFGLTNEFSFKRLSLNVLVSGKVGGDIYNQIMQSMEILSGYGNISRVAWDNRWQGENTSDAYPKANLIVDPRVMYSSDRYVDDGTYVRIKNVKLAFNFDKKLLRGFPSGQLFVNVENLYTFTNYRSYDPEVSSYGQSTAFRGIDLGAYPQSRTIMAGVSISF